MGKNKELVQAVGLMVAAIVVLSAVAFVTIIAVSDNHDIARLLGPLVIAYSTLMAIAWMGLATFAFLQARLDRPRSEASARGHG